MPDAVIGEKRLEIGGLFLRFAGRYSCKLKAKSVLYRRVRPSPVPKTISFIFIDDHRAVLESITYALEKGKGMKCLSTFASLTSAISASPLPRVDVGIIDWRLGDGIGTELLLRGGRSMGPISWLLCTATPTGYVVKEALAAGVRGCVSKSCDIDEIAQAIEALASGQTYFCKASQRAMMTSLTSGLHRLTATEVSILKLIARGLEPKSIAVELGLADKTIYNSLGAIRDRLKPLLASGSLVDLARFARQQGMSISE